MNKPYRPFTPEAVRSYLRQRDWQIVSPADPAEWESFLDAVADRLRAGDASPLPAAKRLERAVTGAYCTILYAACSADGTYRQHRAYTEIWNWVYSYLARRANNPADAEDIAQEVLLFVSQNLMQVKHPSGFLAWVGGVAYNRFRRYYAKIGAEYRYRTDDPPDDSQEEPNPVNALTDAKLLSSQLEFKESEAEILAILDECLPQKARTQKVVFVDLVLHQDSVNEIAQQRNLKVGAVHAAWSRVRRTLREDCTKLILYLIANLQRRSAPAM